MKEEKEFQSAAAAAAAAASAAASAASIASAPCRGDDDGSDLLARLDDNAAVIAAACASLTQAAHAGMRLAPAASWLLDNAGLVDAQIGVARRDLAKDDRRAPPRQGGADTAADTVAPGRPRICRLAQALVAQDDGRLTSESLARGIAAAQEGEPLTLGELRALPTMLRLALVDKVRHGAAVLANGGRAVDEAALANPIGSLRLLGGIDWRTIVARVSRVDEVLRADPAGVYGRMDGATREGYRQVVERLACASGRSETDVAAAALALANEAAPNESVPNEGAPNAADARRRHVGYWLVDQGAARLEARLGMQRGPAAAWRRVVRARPLLVYLGAVGILTALFSAAIVLHAVQDGVLPRLVFAIGVLAVLGSSQLALALVNMLAARSLASHPVVPAPLPRMDAGAGIPADARTIVVVPALLDSRDNVALLAGALEVHWLANRDPHLRVCLLTDLPDAPQQDMFGDAELVEQARAAIAALNARYGHAAEAGVDGGARIEPFLLLHRMRVWSAGERAWIGRERKRGKLDDFNAFLRRGVRAPFAVVEGATAGLDAIRYVITLDAGTRLPRDAARVLVAAMMHPLNQPVLNAAGTRVVDGYGLLQPRVAAALPPEDASRYARLYSGAAGGDPAACARSGIDAAVDQHLFGESAFSGQGIYDLAIFERVLGGRFPDDRVLAHDLLAGCHLRCGLLDDVHLLQAGPARYSDDVGRRHRGMRGHWQLLGWQRARVPARAGGRVPNPLAPLARWTLFDNLRRSLVAPALTVLAPLCWATMTGPVFWSVAVLSVFFLPCFMARLIALADKPRAMPLRRHLRDWVRGARPGLYHALLETVFLPYAAWIALDAIARTAWRMAVSKRRRLEWRVASLARSSTDLESNAHVMWFAPAFAVAVAVLLSFTNPPALFAAAPLLLLWFLSPVAAWWVSLPQERAAPQLTDGQRRFLHGLARRSWAFFEDHATAADNWLAPERVQADQVLNLEPGSMPVPIVAHRMSPTAIGLALLANVTAHDFGFIATSGLLARTRATLGTLALLERHRGHFYHGYDTRTLAPLAPAYVATVDSGNLAAYLLTLAAGLEQLADSPAASRHALDGIAATLRMVEEAAAARDEPDAPDAPDARDVAAAIAALWRQMTPERCRNADTLPGLADCLKALARLAGDLHAAAHRAAPDDAAGLRAWTAKLASQCDAAYADLLHMAPWMRAMHEFVVDASLTRIPTLRALAAYGMTAPDDDAEAEADHHSRQLLLARLVAQGSANARARLEDIAQLAQMARACAAMDFTLLYDADAARLASGYHVAEERLASGRCEWLASEARLASFVGIARGQLPQAHWWALGRERRGLPRGVIADCLMPLLVMPAYSGTLLDEACHAVVRARAAYGQRHDVPRDSPASGGHDMGEGAVIAPHAGLLALMVEPALACANLERMAALGWMGPYGIHEAADGAVGRSCGAYDQGAGMLALSHLLHDQPMQRRFEAVPAFQATLPLLQERLLTTGARAPVDDEDDGAAMHLLPPDVPAHVLTPTLPPDLAPTLPPDAGAALGVDVVAPVTATLPPLLLDNGIGGFTADGREYVIRTGPGRPTPAPWANVLASPLFGSVVSDSGAAYTWNQNASAFRLTPWANEPDPGPDAAPAHGGEAFYLRDEQTGVYWSPTALPAPSGGEYLTRHGFGYSTFEHSAHGIHSTLLTWVALDAPRKYTLVTLRNDSAAVRRLSVTGYVEWVLGAARAQAAPHVVTECDPASGALFARNGHDPAFADRVAFFCLDAAQVANVAYTCDRAEFIGHGRSLAQPAALARTSLSGRSGAALDPCAALQTVVELQPGEARELVFMLGIGVPDAHQRGAAAADLARVRAFWDDTLGAVRIDTPEPAFDVLANGWLMYQTIACRLWARSAYYQSDGAYDFRGQLQDAMATVHLRPELLRDHILLFARHQFVEGDVQQRWHPPGGVGLRTHCAHDALWLPLAVARHVEVTGDMALLDEIAPFIEGRPLVPDGAADEAPDEAPRWEVPLPSLEQASVYEHCVRAVRRALVFGAHGLPLADSADRGEDVGLAFLLVDVLRRFGDVAERHADYGFATTCRSAAQVLTRNIEDNAWDGACYRHPHDAPSPVDPDAQSWGVLSGAADPERARSAMARAFDPAAPDALASDDSDADASGIHAIRAAMAFAQLGDTARAWALAHGLNPAVQASTPAGCAAYALEPYVMAAPHEAGGGSWTTGAAGWMYRLIVESLLGIGRRGDTLTLTPHLPAAWDGFRVHYRHGGSVYTIAVQRGATHALQVDGAARAGNAITLVDDGGMHAVLLQVPGHQDAGPATEGTDTASQE